MFKLFVASRLIVPPQPVILLTFNRYPQFKSKLPPVFNVTVFALISPISNCPVAPDIISLLFVASGIKVNLFVDVL